MLSRSSLVAFAATTDGARARAFYEGVLGLSCLSDDDFAIVFDAAGTQLRLQKVAAFAPQPFTQLGWSVPSLDDAVDALTRKNVAMERFGFPGQDARGIWTAPTGARIAWFKDPDGNMLSVAEQGGA